MNGNKDIISRVIQLGALGFVDMAKEEVLKKTLLLTVFSDG